VGAIGAGDLHVSTALGMAKAVKAEGPVSDRMSLLGEIADATGNNGERALHRRLKNLFGHSLISYGVKFRLQKSLRSLD